MFWDSPSRKVKDSHLEELLSRLVWEGWHCKVGAHGATSSGYTPNWDIGQGRKTGLLFPNFLPPAPRGHSTERAPLWAPDRTTLCWRWKGHLDIMKLNVLTV